MTAPIYLFDIDGTLLSSGRAGQLAMEQTLKDHFGLTELNYEIATAGRTDRAIIADLFAWHDVPLTETRFAEFRDHYFRLLPEFLGSGRGSILPGVGALLQQLNRISNKQTGLLTGNFETSGWMKLKHFGLETHFSFGAFGDWHTDRDDVARIAFNVVQQRHSHSIEPELIWVIGDTPADIQCARAIGAKVVAVATGRYRLSELARHEPDALFADLADTAAVLQVLSGKLLSS